MDVDAGAFLDPADAGEKQVAGAELRFEGNPVRRRKRDQHPACRLRIESERVELGEDAVAEHPTVCELTVPRVAAGSNPLGRGRERAGQPGQPLRLDVQSNAASLGHLDRMAEQTEAGDVCDRVRARRAQRVGRLAVQRPHQRDGSGSLGCPENARLDSGQHEPRAERFRQEERVARSGAALSPHALRADCADDGQPVLRFRVANRVTAREQAAGLAHRSVGRGENGGHRVVGELLGERGDGEGEDRLAAHREDVVQRVDRRDRPEVVGIVDERREEVDREDERPPLVEPVDRRVVARREPDEQVLGLCGEESGQELLESRRRILRRAAAGDGEVGQADPGSLHPMESTERALYGCQGMTGMLRRVLVKAPTPDGAASWRRYGWRSAPDLARLAGEHEAFCGLLADAGAEVVLGTTPVPGDPDAIYAYDPALVSDRGAVLLRPGKRGRLGEPEAMAADFAAIGVPVAATIEAPATVEGGDTLWLDERTLLVGHGYRTNAAGIAALAEALPEVDVVAFDLPHYRGPGEVLHLMSFISPVAPELAVAYLPLMPVRLVELLREREIRLIEVPDEEFDSMGPNVLALGPGIALALDGNPETRRRMERAGVDVRVYSGEEVSRKGDGGPTCLTRPVLRLA